MDTMSGGADDITKEKEDNERYTMRPKLKYSLSYCPSMSRPLDFSVKGPVPIYIHKKQKVLTGCSYIELKLQKHSKVGEITFRNYYTASVSVLLLRSNTLQGPPMGSRNWEVGIKNRTLMNQPHCENGAQDYFSLFFTEAWNNVSKLKIILRQPSPMCKTFHLEEIKLYADVPRFSRPFFEQKLPPYLIHNTTTAISWRPSTRTCNEMQFVHRPDSNNKTQCLCYVVEQVPNTYDSSKIA
ncbi:uncharacterized protein LOC112596708 isoform X1 [Melanaphis sacchari]|uniref:uncharacterized protein LOC112596708 isoform X1 n=1 Tax=Melanaphis sacchari TaxID=742174 RepID=UPI000DC15A5C|nr:uncharacterized protein LOC112596708 isoform X1 [Melanaphis sacchari]